MKHTAANTALLAIIKREYNSKIYKHALNVYNTDGKEAAFTYLQQFSVNDIRVYLTEQAAQEIECRVYLRSLRFLRRG